MKFLAGIADGEAPVDRLEFGISFAHVGVDSFAQGIFIGNTSCKTGSGEDGEFHLGHIEPTAVLGRVVKFQPLGDGASLL